MLRFKILLSMFVLILLSVNCYSLTLDELLQKSINASGSSSSVKTMKMSGKMSVTGMDMPIILTMKKPALRTEIEMMGMKMVQAFDGTKGWMINPSTNAIEDMPDEMIKQMKSQASMGDNPLATLKEMGTSADLMDNETVDGKEYYKIKLVTKDSITSNLYIDKDTYLPYKSSGTAQGTSFEIIFKDYKMIKGLMMSHLYDITGAGQKMSMKWDAIEINLKVDDSIFKKPEQK